MQPYCTGPARLWVAFPTGEVSSASATILSNYGTPTPFGTCERGVEIVEDTAYEEVMNDFGGTRKQFDISHQGSDFVAGGVVTRYRESVLRMLQSTPGYSAAGIFGDVGGDLGSFMGLEQFGVIFYVEFMYGGGGPFAAAGATAKPVHVSGSLPGGYRFYNASWRGPTRHHTGTGPKKVQFLFHCQRIINPITGFMLAGDENVSAVTGLAWEVTP